MILLAFAKANDDLLVNTKAGPVKGYLAPGGVRVWRGIPYSQPPVGDLRWEYPKAKEPFTEVYDATFDAPGCQQTCVLPPGNCPAYGMSEDCLYLNIFAPMITNNVLCKLPIRKSLLIPLLTIDTLKNCVK